MPPLLAITNLHASVEDTGILHGVSLGVRSGEVHAIMGPNGSGKSTLVSTLMGHPAYTVTQGSVSFDGADLLAVKPDERARKGLFLAFQYPRELPGISLRSFLFAAYNARHAARDQKLGPVRRSAKHASGKLSPIQFKTFLEKEMRTMRMDPSFAERSVNQGWSGGEKKKAEILQLRVLSPRLALLDETDSGLDVDALKIVADGVRSMRKPNFAAIIVTHYARILEYLAPDRVHVMVKGKIVESGGPELARRLEKGGYAKYGVRETSALRLKME